MEDVAELNDNSCHFVCATLEMFIAVTKGDSIILFNSKNTFFSSTPTLLECTVKTSSISIMELFMTANHIFCCSIAPKEG